jgi:muramidase (phage lysozyme)
MPRITPEQAGGKNRCAFLDMLAASEIGARLLAASDDGYNVLVGSTAAHPLLFPNYRDHPNTYNSGCNSTAAGRYQLLYRWWKPYRDLLHLNDFSPVAQDRVALQQIRECQALPAIDAGQFTVAVGLVAHLWASLPGSCWQQHENALAPLQTAYVQAGGQVAV